METSSRVTIDEWLAALADASSHSVPVEGLTVREVATQTGTCLKTTRDKMGALIAAGAWRLVGRKPALSMDGKKTLVPAYAPVKKGKR